jgi:scavenger receptor class B, member 1
LLKLITRFQKNGTSNTLGDFNANTGVDDIRGIGNIRRWKHMTKTSYYEGKCGELSGSSGDFFAPFITKNQTMELFSPEMCRSVLMDFEEEQEILGVKTFKFSGGDRTIDNGTLYPEQECYCGGKCVPSGLFNVSSCRDGTPVFLSFPHFYKADPFYLDQVQGMKPDKAKHQFFMSFEPVSILIVLDFLLC